MNPYQAAEVELLVTGWRSIRYLQNAFYIIHLSIYIPLYQRLYVHVVGLHLVVTRIASLGHGPWPSGHGHAIRKHCYWLDVGSPSYRPNISSTCSRICLAKSYTPRKGSRILPASGPLPCPSLIEFVDGFHMFSSKKDSSSELRYAKNNIKVCDRLQLAPSSGNRMQHLKSRKPRGSAGWLR